MLNMLNERNINTLLEILEDSLACHKMLNNRVTELERRIKALEQSASEQREAPKQ